MNAHTGKAQICSQNHNQIVLYEKRDIVKIL
jgi:hypothetical protein